MGSRRGNLRAHVRVLPFTSPAADAIYTWRLFAPQVTPSVGLWDERGLLLDGGTAQTLSRAMEQARAAVRAELEHRRENIASMGYAVADCPMCGDPCEYEEEVRPGGHVWARYLCDSCGHEDIITA